MGQQIINVKGLTSQLREAGAEILAERVTKCIMNGLGQMYQWGEDGGGSHKTRTISGDGILQDNNPALKRQATG